MNRLKPWHLILISVLVGMASMEAAVRTFIPHPDPHRARRRVEQSYIPRRHEPSWRIRARPEPGLSGVSRPTDFNINALGFRGEPMSVVKPENERRVFLIGGSTTESALLAEETHQGALLSKRLAESLEPLHVSVQNAGHSGDATFDHVALLAHRIVHLSPDVVIVLAGLNDLRAAIEHHDYLHLEPYSVFEFRRTKLIALVATELHTTRWVWAVMNPEEAAVLQRVNADEVVVTNYKWAAELCRSRPEAPDPPPTDLDPFRRNLVSLIRLSRGQQAEVILMTQPTTWGSADAESSSWHWLLCVSNRRYSAEAMDAALRQYNDAIREVAREEKVPLVDLEQDMPKSLEHMYDDAHFNERGAERIAELLAEPVAAALRGPSP